MRAEQLRLIWDAHTVPWFGARMLVSRQRARLAALVAHARSRSPYFREHYRGLPELVEDTGLLPVTNKRSLMAHFEDWVTDREVTLEKAQAFVSRPDLVGERFLGKYAVATTSGTTGASGIFLLEDRSFAVSTAVATRMLGAWLDPSDVVRILAARSRMAMIMAREGHFASAVAAARLRRRGGRRARRIEVLSVHTPLPELVERLNRFQPTLVAPYASMAVILANEQEAGRLQIEPVLLALAAEGLPIGEYRRIAEVFGAKVGNSYAATECPFLSHSCREGWLHVNSDWVILEPVDADYRATPPGKESHTVLISNLANRIQPILRYDLGDRVVRRPDACPCGSVFPAIRVRGRASELLIFTREAGERVAVPPLAFHVGHVPGLDLFQVHQTTPTDLVVRLRVASGTDPEGIWPVVLREIQGVLAMQGLHQVNVHRGSDPPAQSRGGKYRIVIPLDQAAGG